MSHDFPASNTIDYDGYANAGNYFPRYHALDGLSYPIDDQPYFAAIYNEKGGTLNATNLYIGIGAHFSMLYNRGTASINRMYTEFSQNGSAYYDRWNLRLFTVIINEFGTLRISNSDIVGADASLIDMYGGTVELKNVTLAQSMMGITTYYSAESILMDTVNLYEIGKFYASLGAATYTSIHDSFDPVWFTTPCHLSADSVTLKNSKFSYVDAFGVLQISEYGVLDPHRDETEFKTVNMVSNEFNFYLDSDTDYDGYSYRSDFSAFDSMLNEAYGTAVDLTSAAKFSKTAKSVSTENSTGLLVVERGYEFVIGNNHFSVDVGLEGNDSDYTVDPYLYLDSGSADGCIAGNDLENIDIVVKSGNIKSCKHYGFDLQEVQ